MLPPVYATKTLPVTKQDMVTHNEVKEWKHLSNIDLPNCKGTPTKLLGNNVPAAAEPYEIINSPTEGAPYALRTKLGWIIKGSKIKNKLIKSFNVKISNSQLEKLLTNMYEIDFKDCNDTKKGLSQDDKVFLNMVEN